ncbi:MAG: glycine cleavage system protein GcvH [Candidatus Thermoplasmatota archaeon]|nr:glycine cleavage system protein GcvH [Euryarchaeota archaeon]MBU4032602.1 glycine cleavage system protein GcvH [Candidatus Thermoplasmatota archaeon]MBU4071847.1 glycine cleavage system protein GcvH [Candidatus Thermoplasmatota archaeon]MBU4143671.1 glycine cleavage system protein GcvH [Candidatus Thermoplasmatota archaeon]MBU4591477.1 glycine cleavage system protein GcvH [Candidatus Thermoplasmatota archaeon]
MSDIEGFNMPDDLYYHKEHAWVKILDDGTVKVGMSDFYQKNSGDTTYIDLPFEGDDVEQGETCGKIQSAKWVGKFVSPLTGKILSVNEDLEDDSTLINKEPYENGWIMTMKPSDLDGELANLFHGGAVSDFVKKEIADIDKKKQQQ